jgi:hypothetical protein
MAINSNKYPINKDTYPTKHPDFAHRRPLRRVKWLKVSKFGKTSKPRQCAVMGKAVLITG